jgi:hypothetical protein
MSDGALLEFPSGTARAVPKDWAFAIARRSTMRKARIALAPRLQIIMHAMLRGGTEFAAA